MTVKDNDFELMGGQTQPGMSRTYSTNGADTVTLDVSGSATDFVIEVQGKMSPDADFRSLFFTIRLDNGEVGQFIKENGTYIVDATGICSLRLNTVKISSGSISVVLRATSV